MAKKNEKKFTKKHLYYIIAVLLVCALVVAICLMSCEKEPVIGYDPPTPQEWLDELEAEKNRPDTEIYRTYDLDGIWRDQATGQYYQVYMGIIFKLNNPDAAFGEYSQWGTMVAEQTVLKEKAEEYDATGGNELVTDEQMKLHINSIYLDNGEATLTIVDQTHTKVTTIDGSEFYFEFIEARDEWPEGYAM